MSDPAPMLAKTETSVASPPARRSYNRRGVEPPPPFDVMKLPDGAVLTRRETSGAVRLALVTLDWHRKHDPYHPLKWVKVGTRSIRYTAGSVKKFLSGRSTGQP